MVSLKEEVNSSIMEFMETAEALRNKTKERASKLQQVKDNYNKILTKHDDLRQQMVKQAEDQALVEATQQVETEIKEKQEAQAKLESEERQRQFELEKIRVQAEADARVKYELELKH